MTLLEFLAALDGNNIVITVSDADNDEIIKFYAGTTALDDALEARTIKKLRITGATTVSIFLNNAE
jgi:tRNA threonylcarbamoyladenosine modification (KEOPS) complex Cgi121 subunit